MKNKKPSKELKNLESKIKKIIKRVEAQWKKDIKETKNPVLRTIKGDYKKLCNMMALAEYFEIVYGIRFELKSYKPITNSWGKSITKQLYEQKKNKKEK